MTDPIADIIGDYRAFAAQQRDRLLVDGWVPQRLVTATGPNSLPR
jgi:hypothetical protein